MAVFIRNQIQLLLESALFQNSIISLLKVQGRFVYTVSIPVYKTKITKQSRNKNAGTGRAEAFPENERGREETEQIAAGNN